MSSSARKRLTVIFIGLIFLTVIFLFVGLGLFFLTPAEKGGADQVIVVQEGLSLKEVATELERRKIITNKALFMLWARFMGYSRKIKAGEYLLSPDMAPVKVLEKLTRGAIITHPVTIPEGYTRGQIAELLQAEGLIDKNEFLSLTEDPAILARYGIPGQTLEGYLYPDTYQFARGISALSAIDAMVQRFWQMVGPLTEGIREAGMTLNEVIILASIVEKETGRIEERPAVASVFLNRLHRGMRLASDPTVIYGLNEFNGNLTKRDLSTPTPYNTYIIHGLPPGPIANPGLESIKAVVYPAKTKYLYFVSKNDGSHHFSETLSEHNKAVQVYQIKGRKSRGKTP
jgi:UPF0755 protein